MLVFICTCIRTILLKNIQYYNIKNIFPNILIIVQYFKVITFLQAKNNGRIVHEYHLHYLCQVFIIQVLTFNVIL